MELGDCPDVSVKSQNFRSSGKNSRDGTVTLGPLGMNDIRPNFFELSAHGKDAAGISSAKPTDLRNVERVEPNIVSKF
jgi:hypothetical protein